MYLHNELNTLTFSPQTPDVLSTVIYLVLIEIYFIHNKKADLTDKHPLICKIIQDQFKTDDCFTSKLCII